MMFGMITIINSAGSSQETAHPAIFFLTEGIRISAISQINIRYSPVFLVSARIRESTTRRIILGCVAPSFTIVR